MNRYRERRRQGAHRPSSVAPPTGRQLRVIYRALDADEIAGVEGGRLVARVVHRADLERAVATFGEPALEGGVRFHELGLIGGGGGTVASQKRHRPRRRGAAGGWGGGSWTL